MDRQVEGVVAFDFQAAQSVVDGQGKIDNGPSLDSLSVGRGRKRFPDGPERTNGRVFGNRSNVVEDERCLEAVGIDEQSGGDDYGGEEQ